MEKGDILTCVCDFDDMFFKGNDYMVIEVEFTFFHDHRIYRIYISSSPLNDPTIRGVGVYWFLLDKTSEYYLYNYFSDIKTIRKEKLKKIGFIH